MIQKIFISVLLLKALGFIDISHGMERINKEDLGITGGIVLDVFDLIQIGADNENAMAQFALGECYLKGLGFPKNNEKAFEWFEKSAQKGFKEAEFYLGLMYLDEWKKVDGTLVFPDFIKALEWFEKSAEHGYSKAQYNAGLIYYDGDLVEKDLGKAFQYFLLAAKQGEFLSQVRLCDMYSNGWSLKDGTRISPDPLQLFDWTEKTANNGNPYSLNDLGNLYYKGLGTTKDLNKAFECWIQSAKQGLHGAQKNVGVMLESGWEKQDGTIIQPDLKEAIKWFEKSAEQNGDVEIIKHIISLYKYGQVYHDHNFVQQRIAYWTKKHSN